VTQSIQKEAQGYNLKKKGNWVKPNEKFCIFARMAHIFRHWCKRQGFQRCYLVVLNDIVYEETDIIHIQMLCSLVVEKPICGVVCRNWRRRRRRRWEAKSRRRKTPRRSKSYQSTPTGLSSNKLSFSSIYLSLSIPYTCFCVFTTAHVLDFIPCLQNLLVYADATNSWLEASKNIKYRDPRFYFR